MKDRLVLYLTLILLLGGLNVLAQKDSITEFNKTDSKGLKQGPWRKYYDDGKLRYTGSFKNDKPIGEFRHYYPGIEKIRVIQVFDEKGYSDVTLYYENGEIMAKGHYKDTVKDGQWSYYNYDGKLVKQEFYKNTMPDGCWKIWNDNGTLMEERNFSQGKYQGLWIRYYSNGKVWTKVNYVNDHMEGLYVCYSSDGILLVTGNYKNGYRVGVWKYFNDYGHALKEEIYKNGELVKVTDLKKE